MSGPHIRPTVVFALGITTTVAIQAQGWVARYECKLADGAQLVFARDLTADFSLGVSGCRKMAIPVPDAPRQFDPAELGRPSFLSPGLEGDSRPAVPVSAPLSGVPSPRYAAWIGKACEEHGVDPAIAAAVIHVESRFRADARSPKGALGLMQVMPATASRYGVATAAALLDPRVNIDVGVRHLRGLLDRFGRLDLALAAYNAGEAAVLRHGLRIPPFVETERYVEQVLAHLQTHSESR